MKKMKKIEFIQSKIIQFNKLEDRNLLVHLLAFWIFKNKKIVFTNGCFDLVHLGHVDYLSKAADLGDILIVGLNSDESVRKIKGDNRPIIDQHSRAMVMASMLFVNAVIIFDEETPYELIRFVQPDILVKGNDYTPDTIVGTDIVRAKGGQIATLELVEGYSTSIIEKKILSGR